MDVPGLSCSPGVGICACDTRSRCALPCPPATLPAAGRVLMVLYLCVCLLFPPWKPFTRRGATLVKQGWGSLSFPGRWHVSQQREKACRPRLAGSDLSQRRFACCHSQSKMPPLPRSQSATFLFVSLRDTRRKARGLQVWPGGHPGPLKVIFYPRSQGWRA